MAKTGEPDASLCLKLVAQAPDSIYTLYLPGTTAMKQCEELQAERAT